MSPIIANINLIIPKQEDAKFSDIPGSDLSNFATGQTETGVQSQAYNRAGRRDIGRNGPIVNAPAGKGGVAKGAAILDAIKLGLDTYLSMTYIHDQDLIKEHREIANKVAVNVTDALNSGMIPIKYQNTRDIGNIMNVVLQGTNNSNNKEIFDIGMSIYNKYNPKPEVVKVPSGLDNVPAKQYNLGKPSPDKTRQ